MLGVLISERLRLDFGTVGLIFIHANGPFLTEILP